MEENEKMKRNESFLMLNKNITKENWYEEPFNMVLMVKFLEEAFFEDGVAEVKYEEKEVKRGEFYTDFWDLFMSFHLQCVKKEEDALRKAINYLVDEKEIQLFNLEGKEVKICDLKKMEPFKVKCLKYDKYIVKKGAFIKFYRGTFKKFIELTWYKENARVKFDLAKMYLTLLIISKNDSGVYTYESGSRMLAAYLNVNDSKVQRLKSTLQKKGLIEISKYGERKFDQIVIKYEEMMGPKLTACFYPESLEKILLRENKPFPRDAVKEISRSFYKEKLGVEYKSNEYLEKDLIEFANSISEKNTKPALTKENSSINNLWKGKKGYTNSTLSITKIPLMGNEASNKEDFESLVAKQVGKYSNKRKKNIENNTGEGNNSSANDVTDDTGQLD